MLLIVYIGWLNVVYQYQIILINELACTYLYVSLSIFVRVSVYIFSQYICICNSLLCICICIFWVLNHYVHLFNTLVVKENPHEVQNLLACLCVIQIETLLNKFLHVNYEPIGVLILITFTRTLSDELNPNPPGIFISHYLSFYLSFIPLRTTSQKEVSNWTF